MDESDRYLRETRHGSRGFVRKDGTVFGWSLLVAEHSDYHREHGTSDDDFLTRWRQWSEGERIDIEERELRRDEKTIEAVEAWITAHYDEKITMPRA